jgi:hypothetical protein
VRGERFYLQLPPLSERFHALADSLTAGQPTRYDSVLAVQQYLRTRFSYTLDLPATAREATLEHFLFRRRAGHCEYFSTALAILLRSVGIPTRNVNGFLGGKWNEFGQFVTVSQNEAHSWVEVWFPRYGWIQFDGTPAATTDVAAQQNNWLGPMRAFMDGFEHRWNKWILEYNLETQVALLSRVTQPFTRENTGETRWNPAFLRWLKVLLVLAVVIIAARMLFGLRRNTVQVRAEARSYLRLRRAYEKAGLPIRPHDPPIAFLARLRSANAPGLMHAQRVVDAYLRARFSANGINAEEKRELAADLQAALRALRSWRAGLSKMEAAA